MAEANTSTTLRKKASGRRAEPEIQPVTTTSALGNALGRAGEALSGLVIRATSVTEERVVLSSQEDALAKFGLLSAVEGPNSSFGLLVADLNLVSGLVESQTIGRVLATPAAARETTRTDAMLCADFFDCMLEYLEKDLGAANSPILDAMSGFRFAMPLTDFRAVVMALDDVAYRCLRAEVDLAGGAKNGVMMLLLPYDPIPDPTKAEDAQKDEDRAEPHDIIFKTHAELNAILYRTRMSLHEVTGLGVGMTIPLPKEVLDNVSVEDRTGKSYASCRLGQSNGWRAVRIELEKEMENQSRPNINLSDFTPSSQNDSGAGNPSPVQTSSGGRAQKPNVVAVQTDLTSDEPSQAMPNVGKGDGNIIMTKPVEKSA